MIIMSKKTFLVDVWYRKSPKFGHILNFHNFFRPEQIFFETYFTVQKNRMALSTSGLNHRT